MITADVLVVGTGAAGLFTALNLPEQYRVLTITKSKADEADSFLAQGGMCMLLDDEDYDSYFEDTMRAGVVAVVGNPVKDNGFHLLRLEAGHIVEDVDELAHNLVHTGCPALADVLRSIGPKATQECEHVFLLSGHI